MSSKPELKKKTSSGVRGNFAFAYSAMQGWRPTMEDTHRVSLSLPGQLKDWAFAAIFDGHGGKSVAAYLSKNLLKSLVKSINKVPDIVNNNDPNHFPDDRDMENAIMKGFLNFDETMRKSKLVGHGGSTATCALISPTDIYIINVGDSRSILYSGNIIFATKDHKPSKAKELKRITAAGGTVIGNRVHIQTSSLAMSRAFGNFKYKSNEGKKQCSQMIIPKPDIAIIKRNHLDQFLVLASDGIFDVMSNSDLTSYIVQEMSKTSNLTEICNRVIDACFIKGSKDNMSIVILTLPGCPSHKQLQLKRKINFIKMNQTIVAKKKARISHGSHNSRLHNISSNSQDARLSETGHNPTNEIDIGGKRPYHWKQGRVANPFIVYFVDYWKRHGGNICKTAKHCGQIWGKMTPSQKRKYNKRFKHGK